MEITLVFVCICHLQARCLCGAAPVPSPTTPPTTSPSNFVALSSLYGSTTGIGWTVNTNWMSSDDPCSSTSPWYGVTCTSGEITTIIMNANHFAGCLPSELGLLSSIKELRMYSNSITGTLPSEVGQMTSMTKYLFFQDNSISGTIPSQFGLMSQMTQAFHLDRNQLTGTIPSELGQMTSLSNVFQVYQNSLTGTIPSQLGRMSKLTTYFSLYSNGLCGDVPPEVSALSSQVTTGWSITAGNSLGTSCPTLSPTSVPSITSLPSILPIEPTAHPTPSPQSTTLPTASPTASPSSTQFPSGTPTMGSNALYFPGSSTSSYWQVEPFTFPQTFTIEMWVKPLEVHDVKFLLSFAADDSSLLWYDNCLLIRVGFPSSGSWYHTVITYDGSSTNVYVDGVLSNSMIHSSFCGSHTGSLVLGQDQDSYGGGFDSGQAPAMYVDSIAIYDEVLSSSTIAANMDKTCLDTEADSLYAAWLGDRSADEMGSYTAVVGSATSTTNESSIVSGQCDAPTQAPTSVPSISSLPTVSIAPTGSTPYSCSSLSRDGVATSGTYTIWPTGSTGTSYQVYCDMVTDGGGWMLTLGYNHVGGELVALDSGTIPTDPATAYSHVNVEDMYPTSSEISEVRFYCDTNYHSRIIHFKTATSFQIGAAFDGDSTSNYASYWNTGYTELTDHTGYLPGATVSVLTSTTSGLTYFPFYKDNTYHWGINAASRFECDDANLGYNYDTQHLIYVKMVESMPTTAPTVSVPPTAVPTLQRDIVDFDDNSFSPLSNTGSYSWFLSSGSTGSTGTGPTGDHTSGSGYYAYVESSSNFNQGPYVLEMSVSGMDSMSFHYSMYGSTMGTLNFDTSSDGGSTWTTMWTKTGNQGTDWLRAALSLNDGSITDIRFSATTGSSYTSDFAIDDLAVRYYVTPSPSSNPSALPTVSLLPTVSSLPTAAPTPAPSFQPSPTPSQSPTPFPSTKPSPAPSFSPLPTETPTMLPSEQPTAIPFPSPSPVPTPMPNPLPSVTHTPTVTVPFSCASLYQDGFNTSDVYTIYPNGPSGVSYNVYCDMVTDGGGWMLTWAYNHIHRVYTTITEGIIPQSPSSSSHVNVEDLGYDQVDIIDTRFYCTSTAHSRVMHFTTNHSFQSSVAFDGDVSSNAVSYWSSGYTTLSDHTAYLPGSTENVNNNGGISSTNGYTDHPFYKHGYYHWNLNVVYNYYYYRYECDNEDIYDYYDTKHLIFVKLPPFKPTPVPTISPTSPTTIPTTSPTSIPTLAPTAVPSISGAPTPLPTARPTPLPSFMPTSTPSPLPTAQPTPLPSFMPTSAPSPLPTEQPSPLPSFMPTSTPIPLPSAQPTPLPSFMPTSTPSPLPTAQPTPLPTVFPTAIPSLAPTTTDTVIVDVAFSISAVGAPTQDDEDHLKTTVANTTELSSMTSATSTLEFEAQIELDLNSDDFSTALTSSLTSVSSVGTVVATAATRNPSSVPTLLPIPYPTVLPTPSPTPRPTNLPAPLPTPIPSPVPDDPGGNGVNKSIVVVTSISVIFGVLVIGWGCSRWLYSRTRSKLSVIQEPATIARRSSLDQMPVLVLPAPSLHQTQNLSSSSSSSRNEYELSSMNAVPRIPMNPIMGEGVESITISE